MDRNALPGHGLNLAIEGIVVSVFGHQHLSDKRFRRQAALDHMRRRGRLNEDILAGLAGVFRPMGHDDLILDRDDVEPPGDVFVEHVKRA